MSELRVPEIYSDPILSRRRKGTNLDPYVKIVESLTVEKHYVLLSEIPNNYNRVKVSVPNSDKRLHEVEKENGLLRENDFRVDYVNGIVYFHDSLLNTTLDFEYTGEGVYLFPDSRVYYTADDSFPNLRDKLIDVDREILVERHRIDEQILSHPQPSEVVDTRIDYNGKIFRVAKDRIDAEQQKIEEAYIDAKGKRFDSLKLRIDSLQLATEEEFDEQERENTNIWASIDLVPGQITLETGKLEEKVNQEVRLLQSQIDMTPEKINIQVQELKEYADGRFEQSTSQIKVLSDEIDMKVDVDGAIASINLSKENIRLKGKKIHLDGESRIDDAVIKSAHIDYLSADKIKTGTLSSQNNNTRWNLNTGELYMKNADFTIDNGGQINFTDPGNKIMYAQTDPQTGNEYYVGMGLGRNINRRFPFVYLGTTKNNKLSVTDGVHFTGFISNTGDRIEIDDAANSVVGDRFHIRDKAKGYRYGFRFDLNGNVKTFWGLNSHHDEVSYDIGASSRRFRNVYAYNIRHNGEVRLRDSRSGRTGGWLMQTHYAGDGSAITLRGLNGGKYNYSIGGKQSYNRIRSIFLRNKPNVSSDIRLKEDVEQLSLGLDLISELKPSTFRFKKSGGEVKRNKKEFGFIAQDLDKTLKRLDLGINDYSLLSKDDDGFFALEHEQLIAPIVLSIQELNIENKQLKEQVKILKNDLENIKKEKKGEK